MPATEAWLRFRSAYEKTGRFPVIVASAEKQPTQEEYWNRKFPSIEEVIAKARWLDEDSGWFRVLMDRYDDQGYFSNEVAHLPEGTLEGLAALLIESTVWHFGWD